MMKMTDYRPVSCDLHSQYEYYIIARTRLSVNWHNTDNTQQHCIAIPDDIFTRQKEEFLKLRLDDGTTLELRLDRIIDAAPV